MSFRNNCGFSIVELLVVVGMLGGVSLVAMNIGKLTSKSTVKMQLDSDITLTINEINGILSDPIKCKNILGNTTTPTSMNGKYFTIASGSAPAAGHGNSGLKIISYTLSGTAPDGVLTILFENKNILKGVSGASSISKKINLYIEGTLGAITNCRSVSTGFSDIWERGTGQDINYNAGKVGIGIAAPTTSLQVAGPIATALTTKNSSYGITDEDSVILGDATSGSLTFTLPSAVGIVGREYTIKKIDSSTNAVNLVATSSQTVDGVTQTSLSNQWDFIKVVSSGSGWMVTSGGGKVQCSKTVTTPQLIATAPFAFTLSYTLVGGGGGGGSYNGANIADGPGGSGGATVLKKNGSTIATANGGAGAPAGSVNNAGPIGSNGASVGVSTISFAAGDSIVIDIGGGGGGGGAEGNSGNNAGAGGNGGSGTTPGTAGAAGISVPANQVYSGGNGGNGGNGGGGGGGGGGSTAMGNGGNGGNGGPSGTIGGKGGDASLGSIPYNNNILNLGGAYSLGGGGYGAGYLPANNGTSGNSNGGNGTGGDGGHGWSAASGGDGGKAVLTYTATSCFL